MAESAEIDLTSLYDSLQKHSLPADFKFIMLHSLASVDREISTFDNFIIQGYRFIKNHSLSTEEMYGLELANVEVERVPIMLGHLPRFALSVKRNMPSEKKSCAITNIQIDRYRTTSFGFEITLHSKTRFQFD